MASGNFFGNSPVSTNLYVTWSSTPNTTTNTSSVTVNLYMRHYRFYASAVSGSYLSVGGNSSNYSKSISYSGSSQTDTLLTSKTVTVSHNADGSGTCNITGTFVLNGTLSGTYVGTITASKTVTLDKIARSSSIDKITNSSGTTISAIDSGSGIRVYWTPATTSYKYRIQCVVSGYTYTFPSASTYYTPNTTSSYYASIMTEHSWVPSKPSDNVSVMLHTYDSNGNFISDTKYSSFALNVPPGIVPSITSFNATVVDGKGSPEVYVFGKSKVKLTVTANKGNGAANISSYTFNGPYIDNQNSSVVKYSTATSYNITSGILNYAGTLSYTVTVTDTRGRSVTSSVKSIVVQPYATPSISSITVQRCDSAGNINESGTYAYVTVNSSYSLLNGNNTRTVVLTNSSDNYATETTIQTTSNTSGTYQGKYGNGSFAIGSSYTIRATIKDTAYSASSNKSATLKTASRPINMLSNGKGVAIGKMAETANLFDVGWDAKFNGSVNVANNLEVKSGAIELNNNGSLDNYGGHIDFHYNKSTSDYTSRIIENANGHMSVIAANGVDINGNNIADFVIEKNSSGTWMWQKWNSGLVDCWTISNPVSVTGAATSVVMGGYYSWADVALPSGLFTRVDSAVLEGRLGTGLGFANVGNISATTLRVAVVGNQNSTSIGFRAILKGRWK